MLRCVMVCRGWPPRTPPFQFLLNYICKWLKWHEECVNHDYRPQKQRAECTDHDYRSQKRRRILNFWGRACVPPTSFAWMRCSRPRPCVICKTRGLNLAVLKFSAPGSDEKMDLRTGFSFVRREFSLSTDYLIKTSPDFHIYLPTNLDGSCDQTDRRSRA